jgi:hypothetical protein
LLIWALLALAWGTTAGAAEEEEKASAAPPARLSLEEALICRGIANRAPLEPGETFESSVGRLYCFTRVTGANRDTVILHIWYPPDRNLYEQSLPVKSPSWRTWSCKTVPADWTGEWHVEVAAEDGTVLKTLVFEVN